MTAPSIPTSTYRLQFHKGFTLHDGTQIVPYLHKLGISHVYASPIFRSSPGSMHGYDICDHNEINPELGGREAFNEFSSQLQRHGMRLIIDFVPNHMGIAESANSWWMDVLENGPSSPFARYFDIDWQPIKREMENQVLLPILGDQYGKVLEGGELKLCFKGGSFSITYHDRVLPVAPRTILPLLEMAKVLLGKRGLEVPAELDSIMFTLDHLPTRTETDPERVAQRAREKEVAKSRLERLCQEMPEVEKSIQDVVAEVERGGEKGDFESFDSLIRAQVYRLAFWRVAADEINYRRFFDISSLGALRMELPEVFEATHKLLFELLANGSVSGVRIDHVDGLFDPREYLTLLQTRYAKIASSEADTNPLYLLVEKILGPDERLRGDWPVHGTTGYEVANQLTSILTDPAAETALTAVYHKFIGGNVHYRDVVYQSKLLVMRAAMSSEVNVLGHMLNRISETNRWYRDFTLNALTAAIRQLIAGFPVYRTYLTPDGGVAEEDARVIHRALAAAWRRNPAMERSVFQFLRDVLLPPHENSRPVEEEARIQFVMKFQQCTGPITAKGVEDTSFYIYNRLLALNEVGGEPDLFGETVEQFHRQNEERLRSFPHSLVTTSTHDTKRSEDVRARVAALSEVPEEWAKAVRRWRTANRKHLIELDGRMAPDPNEEYMLYQTLVGSWPLEPMTDEERNTYIKRVQSFMVKALHEAKVNSSWIEPNHPWDEAGAAFVEKILKPHPNNRFWADFEQVARRITELGMVNSLAQTVLKLTVPGVPDVYQGQEIWDFSLVDPDNRRSVDYAARAELLETLDQASFDEMLTSWRDGRLKLLVTQRLLRLRRDHPAIFSEGDYVPLVVAGEHAHRCLAFKRQHKKGSIIVLVPRHTGALGFPPIGDCWGDTHLAVPPECEAENIFTSRRCNGDTFLRDAFSSLPVAVWLCLP